MITEVNNQLIVQMTVGDLEQLIRRVVRSTMDEALSNDLSEDDSQPYIRGREKCRRALGLTIDEFTEIWKYKALGFAIFANEGRNATIKMVYDVAKRRLERWQCMSDREKAAWKQLSQEQIEQHYRNEKL